MRPLALLRPPTSAAQVTGVKAEANRDRFVLVTVWVVSALYLAAFLNLLLLPRDAGMLAESAERVLRGQIPHRDFIGVYTGGLAYLNALAFRVFGTSLFSLRIPLFVFFLGWVPSLYFVARRFSGPVISGVVTLLAVAWSVPNYPEAMPSWYNLFFATWGTLALLRYVDTEKRRWLWVAGLCAGLSLLVKIIALYFVAACLLFFVYREASISAAPANSRGGSCASLTYKLFAIAGLSAFLYALIALVSTRPTVGDFLQFVLPSGCLAVLVGWWVWVSPTCGSRRRFGQLFGMALPFVGGLAIPVLAFLSYYVHEGALAVWFVGTFFGTSIRTSWAANAPVSSWSLLVLIPIVFLATASPPRGRSARWVHLAASLAFWMAVALAARKWYAVYLAFGAPLALFFVFAGVAAPFCLRPSAGLTGTKVQQAFLVVAVGVTAGLCQFPYATTVYFIWVAPLLALALSALWSTGKRRCALSLWPVLGFYLLFAVWLHTPALVSLGGVRPGGALHTRPVPVADAHGMETRASLARQYAALVALVRAHARGSYIYCTPDCPEVYFFSGFRNPTKTIYDFLDPDFLEPSERVQRILGVLRLHSVSTVVLSPPYISGSGSIPPDLRAALDAEYPAFTEVDGYQVRWKK